MAHKTAIIGLGMAQDADEEPTVVGFGVSDQPSGRLDLRRCGEL